MPIDLPHRNSLATALFALSSLATLHTPAALTSLATLDSLTILAALATLATLTSLSILAALSAATQSGCVAASIQMLIHLLLPCEALRTHLRNRQRRRRDEREQSPFAYSHCW